MKDRNVSCMISCLKHKTFVNYKTLDSISWCRLRKLKNNTADG
ncbi:hypothetical protein HMPREF1548_01718 [Clostridium sp. KLE 1755]|nr:hypothetical protein HMPREF1548_01718 [Clostridium sp. KLE 1755]